MILVLLLFATSNGQNVADSTQTIEQNDSTFVMTKSPWGAVARSALIPGWGQFYNESYWKTPVVWGVLGWFTYLYIENDKLYKDYGDLYKESVNNGNAIEFYRTRRNDYRDERDKYALVLGISYFLNLVDSYVDAQLFDFDVTENPITRQPELSIKYKF